MAKQIQLDWFDTYMRVGITRRFVPYSGYLQTLDEIAETGARVIIIEVVAGGYNVTTKENDNTRKAKIGRSS